MKTARNILFFLVFTAFLAGCETMPKDGKTALDAYAKSPVTAGLASYDGGPKNGNILGTLDVKF